MVKIQLFFGPSSSQQSQGTGEFFFFWISTFFARVPGQNVSLNPNQLRNMALFWYAWLWTPITLARVDEMQIFFCPSPSHRDDGSRGEKVFDMLTLFARVAGHTSRLPSPKLPFWAFAIARKDRGRVQLHQDGQEDVRKAPFHGQFAPIWPVSAAFTAKKANQTTEMGVVSVGKG